jgi:hypothetical protein
LSNEEVLMRAKRRGHPLSRARTSPPPGVDVVQLAQRASYQLSAEHKDRYLPSTGVRRLRTDATPCPPEISLEDAQTWLREAIAAGHVGGQWTDLFPRYAWRRVGLSVFEARLTNAEQGWFKGYPLQAGEEPSWLP